MKQMYLRCIAVLLLSMVTMAAYAQKTVTGTVTEKSGQPIPGVSVMEKGTKNGTSTGADGKFSLTVKPGSVLTFSSVGLVTQEVTVGQSGSINVTLEDDANQLGEVVVTALGIKREKKSLGYAVQEIKGETLVEAKEPNLANALSGKVAGLQVVRSSNGPGGSSKIVLRGNTSLTGTNQPLIVVDGVPVDNFTGTTNNDFSNPGVDFGNGLGDISADDIESMSVLKGPSAAALYGSRAGNGVILITTKSGKIQNGLGITVNSSVGIETVFAKPEIQTAFGQGTNGTYEATSNTSWGPKIEGQAVTKWDGTSVPLSSYDNLSNYFNNGLQLNNSISLQQQYKSTSIYTSYNRLDDKSMIPGVKLTRNNLLARAVTNFGKDDRWTADTKVQYNQTNGVNRPLGGPRSENTFWSIYNLPRSMDIRDFSAATNEAGDMLWYSNGNQINPYWNRRFNTNNDLRDRFILNASLKYKFNSWLQAEAKAGADMHNTTLETKTYAGSPLTLDGGGRYGGRYSYGKQSFTETNYSALISASKDNLFGKFGGSATFGGNLMSQEFSSLVSIVDKLTVPNLFSLNNGVNNPVVRPEYNQKKINSIYGTAQVNYDGYLFLDGTFRNDWTSTLNPSNRSFFYPSVSLSYVITEMINRTGGTIPSWLTYAKLRASAASVGNDMNAYQLYNVYAIGKDPNENTTAGRGSILFDPNVKNELIKSYEVGAELRLFDSRLGLDFSWYKSNATNQLINLPMDPVSGYNFRKINAGNVQNQGFEIVADASIVKNPESFNWNLVANFSRNVNKIIDLYQDVASYPLGGFDNVGVVANVGEKYGDIYGTKFRRVEDPNSSYFGQLILNGSGLPVEGARVKLGNQQASGLLGVTNRFAYKNFGLSFLVDARFGGEIFSASNALMQRSGAAAVTAPNGNRDNFVVDGVILNGSNAYEKNTVAVSPQNYWAAVAGVGNLGITEANIYDASNIRLRNVTFSYDLPKSLLSKTAIQRAKIGFSCNNVWLIQSHLNGIDPESVYATGSNAVGFENSSPPTSRTYLFNLTVGF